VRDCARHVSPAERFLRVFVLTPRLFRDRQFADRNTRPALEAWLGVWQTDVYIYATLGIREARPDLHGLLEATHHQHLRAEQKLSKMKPPAWIGFSGRFERSCGALQVHRQRLLRLHLANQLKIDRLRAPRLD
jgi:hypothetical protein